MIQTAATAVFAVIQFVNQLRGCLIAASNLCGGLPWQSVHDGSKLAHDPLRLSVCVEAPSEAVSDVLVRHPDVRALFGNCWLHLFLLDGKGHMTQRYVGNLEWQALDVDTDLTHGVAAA